MSTDTPRPGRVTLSEAEQEALLDLVGCGCCSSRAAAAALWPDASPPQDVVDVVEMILAAREQALREEIEVAAGEWAAVYSDWWYVDPNPDGSFPPSPSLDTYLARIARGGAR